MGKPIKVMLISDTSQNTALKAWKERTSTDFSSKGLLVDRLDHVKSLLSAWSKKGDIVQVIVLVRRVSGGPGDENSSFTLNSGKEKDFFRLVDLAALTGKYLSKGGLFILGDKLVSVGRRGELSAKSKTHMKDLAKAVNRNASNGRRHVCCNEKNIAVYDGDTPTQGIYTQGSCWCLESGAPEPFRAVRVGKGETYLLDFVETQQRKPAVVFVLDHSGSMNYHSEIKYLKFAMKNTLDRLAGKRADFALLGYNDSYQYVYPTDGSLVDTDGTKTDEAKKAEGKISAHDKTATGDALREALRMLHMDKPIKADQASRSIILITDGHRNHGTEYKKAFADYTRKIDLLGTLTMGIAVEKKDHKHIQDHLKHRDELAFEISYEGLTEEAIKDSLDESMIQFLGDLSQGATGYRTESQKIDLSRRKTKVLEFTPEESARFMEVTVSWNHQERSTPLVRLSLKTSANPSLIPYHEIAESRYQHLACNLRPRPQTVEVEIEALDDANVTVDVAFHTPQYFH